MRECTQANLDLSTVIPEALAQPIQKLAHWLNLRPECYLMALLTGISTLHDTETELVLHRDWDFTVTPNLDEEDILSYYDGTGGTVLRANGTQADLDGLLLGILGSIQPGVLQKLLGDFEDSNGNWARFMFVWQPLAASSMVPDGGKFDLTELIAWLYEELDKTSALAPKQYYLTHDAFKLFCEAYNSLERRRIDPATASQ